METYSLDWEKIKKTILSYKACRKLYLDNEEKINKLVKEGFNNNHYHIYKYNSDVEFIIRNIGIYNEKIEGMVVFLLSNDADELAKVYNYFKD